MPWPRFAAAVLIATLLQANLADVVAITRFNAKPDFLLIVMVFFAIRCNLAEAIISSFAIGLATDVITTGFRMGPGIISFGLFGTGLAYLNRIITIRKMPHQSLAIFVIGLGAGVLSHLLAGRFGGAVGLGAIVGTSVYSAVIGPFLFLLLDWSMRIRSRRRV
jgi:rod shape-determining protein MreD